MNTTCRIALEILLLFALTFMLSLGHIVIANVKIVNRPTTKIADSCYLYFGESRLIVAVV